LIALHLLSIEGVTWQAAPRSRDAAQLILFLCALTSITAQSCSLRRPRRSFGAPRRRGRRLERNMALQG
jgi:hypothetical protein